MTRWEPNARERLERAALELFVEQGFAETTVPQITTRAGLTTRTFFRHFADKREVLFANEGDIPAMAARMIAEAPASLTPMEVIVGGLEDVAAAQFSDGVEALRARRAVIESDEGLRERELRKLSALSEAISRGFQDRGVDRLTAALVAQVTVTVFSVSIGRWLAADGETPLPELLHDTLAALRAILAEPAPPSSVRGPKPEHGDPAALAGQ
ncbi:MAG: helix-turn-helix domain-containing protein [Propionibacteriaceae bacterium]